MTLRPENPRNQAAALALLAAQWAGLAALSAAEPVDFAPIEKEYQETIQPLLAAYCYDCHTEDNMEGEVDLEKFTTLDELRRDTHVWEKSLEMLRLREMPPKKKKDQPQEAERAALEGWIAGFLSAEGRARAGDPGRVVLRRLNNVEYTRTVRDLTGVPTLDPAKEFPIDGAAGEGFVNAGEALSMSPALLEKYLAAAQDIASHAVLLPQGFVFSAGNIRGDWTEEWLGKIRDFYARYATTEGGEKVNLQGIVFETNQGGQIPFERYFSALTAAREALLAQETTAEAVAQAHGLSAKYTASLWQWLGGAEPLTPVLADARRRWQALAPGDAEGMKGFLAWLHAWQASVSKFQTVGHLRPWRVPITPLVAEKELRLKIEPPPGQDMVTLRLSATALGPGAQPVWENPRLVRPGQPDLPLREVRPLALALEEKRALLARTAARYLEAAAEIAAAATPVDRAVLAQRRGLDPTLLAVWLDYLGLGENTALTLAHFTEKIDSASGYDAVKGWGSPETPSIMANASDAELRIPGLLRGRGVVVHPAPQQNVAVGWRSPLTGALRVEARITHAHPECGNGVTWALELRRGALRQRLAAGIAHGAQPVAAGPLEKVETREGDLISLIIGPRDGNHACDLTDVSLTLTEAGGARRGWDLAREISADILAANPRPDAFGHAAVWHFYTEPATSGGASPVIPEHSVLARWQAAADAAEKTALAQEIAALLALTSEAAATQPAPEAALFQQVRSLAGPFGTWLLQETASVLAKTIATADAPGLPPEAFGRAPDGSALDPASLCAAAPAAWDVRLPRELAEGAEFAATVRLHSSSSSEAAAQPRVEIIHGAAPAAFSPVPEAQPQTPILVTHGSAAHRRWEQALEDFNAWFPAAVCFPKIVPVDEVVTLTVFHREDEPLRRLLLSAEEIAQIDRLWDELRYIGQDAFTMVDSLEQLIEYSTQDGNPAAFTPLRPVVKERAEALRAAIAASEPTHLDALAALAGKAYRRPLAPQETEDLRALYQKLRGEDVPHEEAFRLVLARVLAAPSFLYRGEQPREGAEPQPVSDWELASRLSYLLWSSMPDDALRARAAAGQLHDSVVLLGESKRMLADGRARALATEFACQWLHIRDFDTLDEKSEEAFPEFKALRAAMYEESILFFLDMFQRDVSVLELLDSDHTFLNDALATHYGIPGVSGPEWRRVEGVRAHGRGGVLGMATVLAKNSGASRTSPILRGNWVAETLLGDKLPKPPPNVPQLRESDLASQLTMRQITELHTQVPECRSCHQRIDPFGFALEAYDTIGRFHEYDSTGRKVDTATRLTWKDDAAFDGLPGLRGYLLTKRRGEVLHTFCRKLAGYALGRSIQLSDGPLIEAMKTSLEQNGHRFSAALEPLLLSPQFLRQRGLDATREEEI